MTKTHTAAFLRRHRAGLAVIGLSVVLLPVPFVLANPWRLGILNLIALNTVVVLGLNLFIGYAGQISLGHAAFFGLGAYGSAVLTTAAGIPPWAAMPITAAGVALAALLIGIPTLRLSGHYLAMATLGFNIVVHHIFVQWDGVTGGPSGLTGIPPFAVPGLSVQGETQHHYLLWGAAMVALTLSVNFVRSGLGRGLAALAEDEVAAAAMGVDVRRGKIAVFTISAAFASVGGSLFAHYMGTITPDTFGIFASIDFVIMVVIGGLGSLWGSIAGAAFVTILPHVLGPLEDYKEILHGLIVVVVLLILPRGLVAGLADLARAQMARRGSVPEPRSVSG
ncbi:MAG: branched-chain amino acid ABC transporter permease [Zetaproteobacteria bacterium]|nr:MAG: branched-chain amino acid ABC transporter permease [Zetaproteobacteria bacterium]